MSNLIDRQAAIDALRDAENHAFNGFYKGLAKAHKIIADLPSAQLEQAEMIKEIREWINSGNRGSADYFIVDKIEEIIDRYE